MRNVFDQYSQPENKLTHALVTALFEDRRLLRTFVRWVTGKVPHPRDLEIVEQRLPGEPEVTEEESEQRGLPDAWIFGSDGWSLLIESKVAAPLKNDQLRRHLSTALKRGFDDIKLLAIDVVEPRRALPDGVIFRKWSDVYEWLSKQSMYSDWSVKVKRFMEVAEAKWPDERYLKEGTLTKFAGIPFSEDEPYNYPEAKRLLKLMMDELRKRKDLVRQLKMTPDGAGRGMITGKNEPAVWDFLPLRGAEVGGNFTKYPHLTVAIEQNRLHVLVTIPNGIKTEFRRNLLNLGFDGFYNIMMTVNNNLRETLRNARGAAPWVVLMQRRYSTQSSPPIIDATLQYDLRTTFQDKRVKKSVKIQPQWLETTFEVLSNRKSNLQVTVGAIFPYRQCTIQRKAELLDYVAGTWIACRPLVEVLITGRVKT